MSKSVIGKIQLNNSKFKNFDQHDYDQKFKAFDDHIPEEVDPNDLDPH